MIRTAILALVAAACLTATSASAAEPKDLVRSFYTEPSIAVDEAKAAGYFAHDLDEALRKDSSVTGQVGAVDFDYRYGAQDVEIRGLQFLQEIDGNQARVVAIFKIRSRAHSVDWQLCHRSDGSWKIFDASSNTGPRDWDLREMLNLPMDRVRC